MRFRLNHRILLAQRGGFTMIEIMIVLAIMAIVMAVGIPSMYRAFQRDDLARAMHDTIEGCKAARDLAILKGVPYEFVIKSEGGIMDIKPAPERGTRAQEEPAIGTIETEQKANTSGRGEFPRKLGEDVMVQLVDVNFVEMMDEPEARVRFYPNGTSDEFTIVYSWHGKQRTVMLDVVTGLAEEYRKE
jgi:prepilin-type N-terminal cleavage/methylation domain-containing protein